jgi:hypothetical protein
MSYGLKIFNWVEDAEKELGGVRSFYEAKEVDDYIRSLKAENKRLQRQYLQAVKAANENIAKNVDGNAKYWQDLCEKRTKMYLEEQAAHISVADELQKQIHKPFPYIEKLKVMKVALFKRMAETAYYHYRYLELWLQHCCCNDETKSIYEPKFERKCRQWKLFSKKAKELEKELEND